MVNNVGDGSRLAPKTMDEMYKSKKTFRGFPCAHRRWRHEGHCAHVHGYESTITIWFGSHCRDDNGFVMDFGQLKPIKAWLEDHFDHTLLIDRDDPLTETFQNLDALGACKLVQLDDVGMEGSARVVFDYVDQGVASETNDRVYVISVEVEEDPKNSALSERDMIPKPTSR